MFNSQIITLPNGKMAVIAPIESQENDRVRKYLENISSESNNPIERIHYVNLKQSMLNGGGPACLRLRVLLNENEYQETHPHVFFDERLYKKLSVWIHTHYRDRFEPKDLADPKIILESQHALDELTKILMLGSIYSFQN